MKKRAINTWRYLRYKPHKLFLILGLCFGLAFVFLIPPFQATDETVHYFRVYQIQEGQLKGQLINPVGAGGVLPGNIKHTVLDLLHHGYPGEEILPYGFTKIRQYFNTKPNYELSEIVQFPNTVVYSPVNYLISAPTLFVANKIFNLSILQSFYVVRIAGLIAWAVAFYFIIKYIPVGKWAMFVFALLPMSVYGAATINADTSTNIIVATFITVVLYLYKTRKKLDTKDWLVLLSALSLLALAKPGYFIVAPLLFILINKTGNNHKLISFIKLAATMIIPVIILLFWTYIVRHQSLQIPLLLRPGDDVNLVAQLKNIYIDPMAVIVGFSMTLLTAYGSGVYTGVVGIFGWMDYSLPLWSVAFQFFLMLYALTYVAKDEKNQMINSKTIRLFSLSLFIVAILAIMGLLYLTWTPVGFYGLEGLQGRYFIPFLPLLIIPLQTTAISVRGGANMRSLILFGGASFMLAFSCFLLIIRFWTHV
jgi:uncharacterized membrane protein